MATTLPTYTRTVDQAFVSTWYDIKAMAVDNILKANVITAALRDLGCFTPQVGGEYITETVAYGTKASTAVGKGDVLPSGENELDTMARWTWRYSVSHIQRSLFDDQKNSGPTRIKSLVKRKTQAARQALEQQIELDFLRDCRATESTGKYPQSLRDIVPTGVAAPVTSYVSYGAIPRPALMSAAGVVSGANSWWSPNYKIWTDPQEVNMVTDMSNMYNTCSKGLESPKLILTDKPQLIKDEATNLANLGYEVLRYKGKPMVWSESMGESGYGTALDMLFLNTDYIKVVYDPNLWFDMSEFKAMPKQAERLAHIFVAWNVVSSQLRRHGLIATAVN